MIYIEAIQLFSAHTASGPVGGLQHGEVQFVLLLEQRVRGRQPGGAAPDDNNFRLPGRLVTSHFIRHAHLITFLFPQYSLDCDATTWSGIL